MPSYRRFSAKIGRLSRTCSSRLVRQGHKNKKNNDNSFSHRGMGARGQKTKLGYTFRTVLREMQLLRRRSKEKVEQSTKLQYVESNEKTFVTAGKALYVGG